MASASSKEYYILKEFGTKSLEESSLKVELHFSLIGKVDKIFVKLRSVHLQGFKTRAKLCADRTAISISFYVLSFNMLIKSGLELCIPSTCSTPPISFTFQHLR